MRVYLAGTAVFLLSGILCAHVDFKKVSFCVDSALNKSDEKSVHELEWRLEKEPWILLLSCESKTESHSSVDTQITVRKEEGEVQACLLYKENAVESCFNIVEHELVLQALQKGEQLQKLFTQEAKPELFLSPWHIDMGIGLQERYMTYFGGKGAGTFLKEKSYPSPVLQIRLNYWTTPFFSLETFLEYGGIFWKASPDYIGTQLLLSSDLSSSIYACGHLQIADRTWLSLGGAVFAEALIAREVWNFGDFVRLPGFWHLAGGLHLSAQHKNFDEKIRLDFLLDLLPFGILKSKQMPDLRWPLSWKILLGLAFRATDMLAAGAWMEHKGTFAFSKNGDVNSFFTQAALLGFVRMDF